MDCRTSVREAKLIYLPHKEVHDGGKVFAHWTGQHFWGDWLVKAMHGQVGNQVTHTIGLKAFVTDGPGVRLCPRILAISTRPGK